MDLWAAALHLLSCPFFVSSCDPERLTAIEGHTVLFRGSDNFSDPGTVQWIYQDENSTHYGSILVYYVDSSSLEVHQMYREWVEFNQSSWSLGFKRVQLADKGLYTLKTAKEEKCFWLEVTVASTTAQAEKLAWNKTAIPVSGSGLTLARLVLAVGVGAGHFWVWQ